jgi:hypothetical protein
MEIAPFSVFGDLLLIRTYYSRMDACNERIQSIEASQPGL